MVALITFTAIGSAPAAMIFYILFISEIAAKMGIVTCATFSNPFPNGTGRFFIESMNIKLLVASLIVTSAIGFLTFNMIGVLGIIGGLIGGIFIAILARKNFKWATGDALGTSNEVARMLALLIMTVVLSSLG
jgi:adenosylcobinamide-GDP ribazoletransferase